MVRGVIPQGSGKLEVREVPQPKAGVGEVVVRVMSAGICGSDLHAYQKSWEEIGERQNLVIGHEAAGFVHEIGQGVDDSLIGKRVSVYHYRGCGVCEHCVRGELMLCEHKRGYGWHMHGADAEYVLTDARNCCVLPDQLTFEDGSFIACAAGTAFSALKKAVDPVPGGTCTILGQGPVGLSASILAKAMGHNVIAIEPAEKRRKFAESLGVRAVEPRAYAADAQWAASFRNTYRPNLVFDATGSDRGLSLAFRIAGISATVVTVAKGMWPMDIPSGIDVGDMIRRDLRFRTSWVLSLGEVYELMDLMVRQRVSFSKLVSARFGIDDAPKAFASAGSAGATGKTIISWE